MNLSLLRLINNSFMRYIKYLVGTAQKIGASCVDLESEVVGAEDDKVRGATCSVDSESEVVGPEACKADVVLRAEMLGVTYSKTESEGKSGMCRSAAKQVGSEVKHDIVRSEVEHDIVESEGKHDIVTDCIPEHVRSGDGGNAI